MIPITLIAIRTVSGLAAIAAVFFAGYPIGLWEIGEHSYKFTGTFGGRVFVALWGVLMIAFALVALAALLAGGYLVGLGLSRMVTF